MLIAAVSGGLDSVGMLYRLLTETARPIHVHHVRIQPRVDRGRWRAEEMAMQAVLPWMLENTRPFVSTRSERLPRTVRTADIVVVTEECAKVGIATYGASGVSGLARGANAHDMASRQTNSRQHLAASAWQRAFGLGAPPIEFPIADMTREALWAMLPPELSRLTWSCRTPSSPSPGHYRHCRACATCKELVQHGIPMERAFG